MSRASRFSCRASHFSFSLAQGHYFSPCQTGYGQEPRQVICQLNYKKSNLRLAQGKQILRATCPKGKLEFKFFSSPEQARYLRPKMTAKLYFRHQNKCKDWPTTSPSSRYWVACGVLYKNILLCIFSNVLGFSLHF